MRAEGYFKMGLVSGEHPLTEAGRRRFWEFSELVAARGIVHLVTSDAQYATHATGRMVLAYEDYAATIARSNASVVFCVVDNPADVDGIETSQRAIVDGSPADAAEMLLGFLLLTQCTLTYAAGLPLDPMNVAAACMTLRSAMLSRALPEGT